VISLDGKTAFVSGAGAGIGEEIAVVFGSLGARVAALEIDPGRADALRERLADADVDSLVLDGDAADHATVASAMSTIADRFGSLDVVVNNVGDHLGHKKPFEESTPAEWDASYRVNLHHVFVVTQAAIPLLRRGAPGGSIINISTIEAFRGIPMLPVYSAFKAAITGFTRSLALELGPEGIRVNAIAPETTETLQVPVSEWVAPEHRDRIRDWIPLGRFGRPADAAGCAVFLATELSSWITGTTIHLDGGVLAACGYVRTPDGRWTHTPVVVDDGYRSARPDTRPAAGST
jgi:NAD(P)-dependent dehydrogenase (short-subunit alcohol dehydrogenase family)